MCTAFSRGGELAISLGEDRRFAAGEFVGRRDVADGTVQADAIVMSDEPLDQLPGVVERQRYVGPQAIGLERLVPTFDLAVRLRIVGALFARESSRTAG